MSATASNSQHDSATPDAGGPEELTGLKSTKLPTAAAGIPAVASALKHIYSEAGLVRGAKALSKLNQKGGFDCPSCAWPDPDDDRSPLAEYCENGAKAVAEEATAKKLGPDFFAHNSVDDLARLGDFEIGKKGRIAQPVYLASGATHYAPISWESAFSKIANSLNSLSSPDEAVFYTSGRTSNEAAFLFQLFAREFGTNNLPDCSNMCHESSGFALTETIGIGKGSVKLEDFHQAEVIIILGQNPGTNHPRMLTALQKAKDNGATIISVNPLPEAGLMGFNNPQTLRGLLRRNSQLTDNFLQVRINGDMALLKALELLLIDADEASPGVLDHAFINERTSGFDELQNDLKSQNLDELAALSGVPLEKIRAAAEVLKSKNRIIACWAMGLTQHENAVATIREVVNLLLMKGSIGKPGAGVCPVRGHSNVQGDRTVGICNRLSPQLATKLRAMYGFEPPPEPGLDTVDSIKAMHAGSVKVFFALGGNFLSATPDTRYTAEALRKCALTVHVSTKLNRSHLVHGTEAIILPCLARSDKDCSGGVEQIVSCENSMGIVQSSKGVLAPISEELLSEPVIVCRLAKEVLGDRTRVDWDRFELNYDCIRDDIEKALPGFEDYNTRVRQPGGFYLPNSARSGEFRTDTGVARFTVNQISSRQLAPGELVMMTIRSHDQFNTTIYGLDDRYRGIKNERRVIFMNETDIASRGLRGGDVVDLVNSTGGTERIARNFVVVPFNIPPQCAATYFPETNVLVPIDSVAEKSNTPASKQVVIRIRRSANTSFSHADN